MATIQGRSRRTKSGEMLEPGIKSECFLLADSAEACNGKLYVLGAGWDSLNAREFPTIHPRITLPIVLSVPWGETNQDHTFLISLRDDDNQPVLPEPFTGSFKLGRPVDAVPGEPMKIVVAVNVNNLKIEREGRYTFVLEVDGRELGRTSFRARRTQ